MNSRSLFSKLFQSTLENTMGFFWKFEIEGLENVPSEHNYIFVLIMSLCWIFLWCQKR